MGKNIILFGLQFDSNLGDQAIFQCTRYMIDNILKEQGKTEIEIREVDMLGRTAQGKNPYKYRVEHNYLFRIIRKSYAVFKIKNRANKVMSFEIKKICRDICKDNIDSDTSAIIFVGGGIIKYKHQDFQFYINEFVSYADKKNIPIMFSAVGIEGYDGNSPECQLLKTSLNRECVKYITTRDDLDTLQNKYCNGNTITAKVADPACWLDIIIPKEKRTKSNKEKCIGLCVVREGLFVEYGIDFDKAQMLAFWKKLYEIIREEGYGCKVFCNGAVSDYKFALDLVHYMNIDDAEKDIVLCERSASVADLVNDITCFDAVISGRLHASIIAYVYDIPSIGLVWNNKQIMFGETIGYPERFVESENFKPEIVISRLNEALNGGYYAVDKEKYRETTIHYLRDFMNESI